MLLVWPAALYKLSVLKSYLFMAYLGLFRTSPWGNEGFLDVWRHRLLDSPLEWAAIAVSLFLCFRKNAERRTHPVLIYALLMLIATARVVTSSTRYALLFMPALDLFAALTLAPLLTESSAKTLSPALVLTCLLLSIGEYREFTRDRTPDPRPPAVLNYIREHRLQNATLRVPREDLPMIHYYFPRTRLHGFSSADRGYPVRLETPH